jgi:sulfur relay (sulfurtransferase) complex TusBCD TusD component (DsrE family)
MEVFVSTDRATVFIFNNDGMGRTQDQGLRELLASKFLQILAEAEALPKAICFYKDGVRLACEGSPILGELEKLEAQGVHLVLCSTCLSRMGLNDAVRVGIVGGMPDIITAMTTADRVITL